ncbi:MAG: sensor histidine kinase [Chloroflexota bacterium]
MPIRLKLTKSSLRFKFALGIALPVLLLLSGLALSHYQREQQLLKEQLHLTTQQLGQITLGALRHAMLMNERDHLINITTDIGSLENIQRIMVIDPQGRVGADSKKEAVGEIIDLKSSGCDECHHLPADTRPRSIQITSSPTTLRIASPIDNEEACRDCHTAPTKHLGMLFIDVSLKDIESQLIHDLRYDLFISLILTVLVSVGVYLLLHLSVVRRIEVLKEPLARLAKSDFSARIPTPSLPKDELDELSETFNRMAEDLEQHVREQEERSQVRHKAIIEERKRIARELHDGLAQLLGYVNTKAMAIRLLLNNRRYEEAQGYLSQLEESARNLFVDTREAILGLKISSEMNGGLITRLEHYCNQFSQLSGLPTSLEVSPDIIHFQLPAEVELHLLRIVQEALTNVRKHANATHAWIHLASNGKELEMTIRDDGKGFDVQSYQDDHRPQFGLNIMRERSESIGANLKIFSTFGLGTSVKVSLKVGEN